MKYNFRLQRYGRGLRQVSGCDGLGMIIADYTELSTIGHKKKPPCYRKEAKKNINLWKKNYYSNLDRIIATWRAL